MFHIVGSRMWLKFHSFSTLVHLLLLPIMLTRLMEARLLAVACISVSVAFLIFVGIVIYHIYRQNKKILHIQGSHQLQYRSGICHRRSENSSNQRNLEHDCEQTPNKITCTVWIFVNCDLQSIWLIPAKCTTLQIFAADMHTRFILLKMQTPFRSTPTENS